MKTFNQLLSYLIIFQLCFACNGGGSSSAGGLSSGSSSSINFSGSLAKAFNSFSDLLVGSAMAQGVLKINDITDPKKPKNLGNYKIEDETQPFNFDLSADQVSEKVIELHYIGNEKSILGERILIINVDSGESNIELPVIDSDETVAAKILKAKIEVETFSDDEEIKSRFKKFVENKETMKEIFSQVGANSFKLLKQMKEESSSKLTLAFASAFVAKFEGMDDATINKELDKVSSFANDDLADIFSGPVLSCGDSSAKFDSPEEGEFTIILTPLSAGLIEKYGKEPLEISTETTINNLNLNLNETIEKFKTISASYKDLQSFFVYVTNQVDFKAGCKFNGKISGVYDISPIESFNPSEDQSFDEITNKLYETFQRVKDEGASYIEQQIKQGKIDDYSARRYQFSKLMEGIRALRAKLENLDANYNNSQLKKEILEISTLTCDNFLTQKDSSQSLQDVKNYAVAVDKETTDNWTSSDPVEYLRSNLEDACHIQFELDRTQSSEGELVDLNNATKVESAEKASSLDMAKKIYQPE